MKRNNLIMAIAAISIASMSLTACTKANTDVNVNANETETASTTITKEAPTEPATVTSEMSITTIDEDGNEVVLTGTAITDADGNITLTATDESGNTVEITGKSAVDESGNTVIEKPTVKSDDGTEKVIEDTKVVDNTVIPPTDNNNNGGNNDNNNNQPVEPPTTKPAETPTTAPTESTTPSHVHTWNPIYGYRQVDEYGEVPVYGVVKRMNGYPFEILACDELGINRDPNQLYLDWHIGENQKYDDMLEAKLRNGELTTDEVIALMNNPSNYPYPETYNYTDPRANTTSQEQIGTKQGVVGTKQEQYIDHYECDGYGWLCNGYLTVDQYNASH